MVRAIRRRKFLKAAGAALAAPVLVGQFARAAAAEETRLRLYWWGSQDRQRRTQGVAELYRQQHPDVSILGESAEADYWTKLVTQIAGRNTPDIFQLEPSSYADYARRGAVMPIDELIPKPLDIASFGKDMLNLCAADGKLWGVGSGLNSFAMIYDADMLAELKLPRPTHETTWKQYADLAVEITKAAGKQGYWGSVDGSRYNYAFDVWLRQRGKVLYSGDQKLGCTVDDAKEWFSYWEDLRKRGGCVAPDIQAMDQLSIDTNALALGKSAISLAFSNQLIGYQIASKRKLALSMLPAGGAGAQPGHFYRAALNWSIASSTKNRDKAADFINFFVNDIGAGKILGVERGVPMSPAVRAAILPGLNETERATVEYVNFIQDKVGKPSLPPPKGANQFDRQVMRPVAEQVAFGKLSIADGAKKLVQDGNEILGS